MKNIIDVLSENNVQLEKSVYVNETKDFLKFPSLLSKKISIRDEILFNSSFYNIKKCEREIQKLKMQNNYILLKNQIDDINKTLKTLKSAENNNSKFKQITLLREKKKTLTSQIKKLEEHFEYSTYSKIFSGITPPNKPKSILYDNSISVSSFDNICKTIPELKNVDEKFFNKNITWFISSLDNLRKVIDKKEDIGIEGGSCLFLSNEFFIIFEHQDGSIKKFDYVDFNERSLKNNKPVENSISIFEYLEINGPCIKNVEIECLKEDISVQDYATIRYLFEIAKALNAKLVVTVPDMSYRKTFYNTFKSLSPDVFLKTKKKFFDKFNSLANDNIKWINLISEQYKSVDATIFHYGNKILCEKFYKSRKKLNPSDINHVSKYCELRDAIIDYIFMPALPYYLFGIKNIIEINRVEEWRSVAKCKKIHKKTLNLTALLPANLSQHFNNDAMYENFKKL